MRYQVILIKSDEGYAVHCPELPACWSQGSTQDEALENITQAISEYLDYLSEEAVARKARLLQEGLDEGFQVELREVQVSA
ncbi:MAG: type II toxin-antitoxin system HicB family antitoxin [Chloroflexota bacterium]|nr:type II toxin-antitoxin system HicB family antitoxin [Chloroflexota bacterium]